MDHKLSKDVSTKFLRLFDDFYSNTNFGQIVKMDYLILRDLAYFLKDFSKEIFLTLKTLKAGTFFPGSLGKVHYS